MSRITDDAHWQVPACREQLRQAHGDLPMSAGNDHPHEVTIPAYFPQWNLE
jgi:hypothetical protein